MNKNRIVYYDIIRIIACFCVIANHTNIILSNSNITNSGMHPVMLLIGILYIALSKPAVTLFVMISGSIFLSREESYTKTLSRAGKILVTLIGFSFVYYIYILGDISFSFKDFIKTVATSNISTAYWYLYMYIGLLLMSPIIRKMITNFTDKDYIYFFVMSLIICSFDFILNMNPSFSLPIFATEVGVYILGYYLNNKFEFKSLADNKRKNLIITLSASISFVLALLTGYTYIRYIQLSSNPLHLMVWNNIFYIFIAACSFILIKLLATKLTNVKLQAAISYIGQCTFGIYLLSDIIIMHFSDAVDHASAIYPNATPAIMLVYSLTVFATGLIITCFLKHCPGIKKLL